MSKYRKTVWSASPGTSVVAPEKTRRHDKRSRRKVRSVARLAAAVASGWSLQIAVLPALFAGTAVFANEAQANPDDSLALGNGAQASGAGAVAVGYMASATDFAALAAGTRAVADSSGSTAVGTDAAALSTNATVLGSGASTADNSANAMAVGHNAAAAAPNTLAIGTSSTAAGDSSVAFGYGAYTSSGASGSMALGTNAVVNAPDAVALGANTWVNAPGAVALGANASVSAPASVALGANTSASAAGSVALGNGSLADRVNAVSIGTSSQQRQIVNVAAGTQNTDAVNVGQLKGVTTAIGGGAAVNPDGTLQQPAFTVNGRTYADISAALAAAGGASDDTVRYDSALHKVVTLGGAGAKTPVLLTNVAAGAKNTDAVNAGQLKSLGASLDTGGNVLNSFAAYDTVVQDSITLKGAAGTKITGLAAGGLGAGSTDAVNGSQLYQTNQDVANLAGVAATTRGNVANMTNAMNSIVNGGGVKYLHANSTLADSLATGLNAVAIGGNASATATSSVAIGSGALADRVNAISVGSCSQQRQIINVAAGTLDTDVVNVSQLKNLGAQMDSSGNLMNSFVTYDDLSNSTVTLGGTAATVPVTLTNVASGAVNARSADAVNGSQLYAHAASTAAALGGGSKVNADGTLSAPAYSIGGNTYGDVGAALAATVMYDSSEHSSVTLGHAGTPVRIANVAAGTLAADSSDAVNGTQLYATNQSVDQNTSNITQNTNDIAKNAGDITHLDTRVTTVEGSVTNLTSQINTGTVGLLQQDPTSRNLSVGKETDGAQVDFTGTAGARELLGVAAGTTEGSAVNMGQLKPVVSALGGGAQINADGSVTGPTYHMQGGTQTTVGDALGSLDNGLTTLQQNIAAGNIGLVTQDATSRIINVGGATDGTLVNLAGTAGNRVVTGVAPGAVNAASTDAVNGSQLYAHAASTAVAFGGGSTVNADGTITAPSYSVGGTSVNSVGGALGNLDGRVTQNTSDIASLQTTVGSISGTVANAVQYDSSAHNSVTLGGSASAPAVKLTNLQAGTLSATSTDAVTGAQLWTTNQQVNDLTQAVQNVQTTGNTGISTNTDGTPAAATGKDSMAIGGGATASGANSVAIGQGSVADQPNTVSVGAPGNERRLTNVANGVAPTDAVNMGQFQSGMSDLARNAYSGTASAIALTMIPDVDANKNLAIGVGTSGYKGYQAMAVGLSARVTQNLKVKLGAGISSATTTVGAGAAYQW